MLIANVDERAIESEEMRRIQHTSTKLAAAIAFGNVLSNGSGNDVLIGDGTANVLNGGDGDDILIGNGGNDVLNGGNGDDSLSGGAGIDIMVGGSGNDIYFVDTVDDQILETLGEGHDVVFTDGSYTLRAGVAVEVLLANAPNAGGAINLSGNEFDNVISGNAGANVLLGNGGNDALIGQDGNDTLDGGLGNDTANGGLGDDIYIVENADDIVVESESQGRDLLFTSANYALRAGNSIEVLLTTDQSGTQSINLSGNEIDNILQGNRGSNILFGGGGADIILAFGGDDTLDGGTGGDFMAGGTGDDIYLVDIVDDFIVENEGEGRDIVYSAASYVLRSAVSVEFLIADPQASTAAIHLTGNEFANTVLGSSGDNILFGAGADDVLLGFGGDDFLNGGTGNDTMIGGVGDDYYFVGNAGDVVSELEGEGRDFLYASISYLLGSSDYIEVLIADPAVGAFVAINLTGNWMANNIQGNAADNLLSGGDGDDVLLGLDGNDTLDGGLGADTMIGGLGGDIFLIDNDGDVVVEDNGFGTGNDTIQSSVSFTLAESVFVENLFAYEVSSTTALNFTGNILNNNVHGNAGSNTLRGGGGDDVLRGFAGNDSIDGGLGTDQLIGGEGDDILYVDNPADVVSGGSGFDTVVISISYFAGIGSEVELIRTSDRYSTSYIDIRGSNTDDIIEGNDGNNNINGYFGVDQMYGFGGNDTLVVSANGSGSLLSGGSGNDTYILNPGLATVSATIVELAGEGYDVVYVTGFFVLTPGSEVEEIVLQVFNTGSEYGIIGNEFNNRILGGHGFDTLVGGGGDDFILGGSKNDILTGGVGSDQFVFNILSQVEDHSDIITDFTAGTDKILLSNNSDAFNALSEGVLPATAFSVGTSAQDADDRIIYDNAAGKLYYDADGNGAGMAILFATLTGAPTVVAADFIVI